LRSSARSASLDNWPPAQRKRRRPGDEARGTRDPARPRGLFSFLGRDEVVKTENSIDSHGFPDTLGSSMQRTPNAAKPVIFAFVARISLR
jgi:hypothetical protein